MDHDISTEPLLPLTVSADAELAGGFYDRVKEWIEEAQRHCKPGEVLDVSLPTLAGLVKVRDIGFANPMLFSVYGVGPTGVDCQIVMHFHTVQLMLSFAPAPSPDEAHRPIGFAGNIGSKEAGDDE